MGSKDQNKGWKWGRQNLKRTKVLKINQQHPEEEIIDKAVEVFNQGGVVCFPTETVYGLGVKISDKLALKKLFLIKGRKKDSPFPIFLKSAEEVADFADNINSFAKKLMDRFWPGPLTLIFKSKLKNLSPYLLKHNKIGIRVSSSVLAQRLVQEIGEPITATSANLSGEKPCVSFQKARKVFWGKADLILDGGEIKSNAVSTVLDASGKKAVLIREGIIPLTKIKKVVPQVL